ILYVRANTKIPFSLPEKWKVCEIKWKFLWTQGGLAFEMMRRPPSILFVPSHTIPWIHPKKTFVTIHGLEYEKCPKGYSFFSRFFLRLFTKCSLKRAHILAVSQSTKKDIIAYYGISKKRISVVYEGVHPLVLKKEEKITKKIPYFVYIGRLEYRKNIIHTVEAFSIFRERTKKKYKLLLVGKPGYGYKNIKRAIKKNSFSQDIIEKGYVTEQEKQLILQGASALLFVSLAEGFGLPILEAQILKVPVVTSSMSVSREIAGKGALFARPKDEEDISKKMILITENAIKKYAIIKAGQENVKRFSWKKCSKELVEVFSRN
ncbi:MAG: glycosyltransferase family 1 protein, partial [Candidatus Moranbacteria bacterium]|nr:glycosyltransferase family 1 protein [Candidatus Moranbacteria bacterium]